jgi:hypothetical protein
MPTLNNNRKPNTRENAVSCANCGLTEKQVSILQILHCCGGSPIKDTQLRLLGQATRRDTLTHFPYLNVTAKATVARSADDLPQPIPPYSTIIYEKCGECGGDGRNHDIDDDYYACDACTEGLQAVLRSWLVEAFQIEAGILPGVDPRREHLTALLHYAKQAVNAHASEHAHALEVA